MIRIHNTLTGRIEPFTPMEPNHLRMYVCGITPYDSCHVGHARCYVVFDVLKRVLVAAGYRVRHVQNFTDIDDKIIDRARQKGRDALTYSQEFIEGFFSRMKELNVMPADVYPRVTTSIPLIIKLVQTLVDRGLGYEVEGDVFYRVRKFTHYGHLSKRNIDELTVGARVSVDEKKEDPLDFALWKKAKEGEPSWPSPWGAGRPGWNIEC